MILEPFDKKATKSNERLGCSMLFLLAAIPVAAFLIPGLSVGDRIGYSVGLIVAVLIILVFISMKSDKRRLAEMTDKFNREFPSGSPLRNRAIKMLKSFGKTENNLAQKILETIPLAERGAMPAELSAAEINQQLQLDTFPAAAPTNVEKTGPPKTPSDPFPTSSTESSPTETPPVNRRDRFIPLEIEPTKKDS